MSSVQSVEILNIIASSLNGTTGCLYHPDGDECYLSAVLKADVYEFYIDIYVDDEILSVEVDDFLNHTFLKGESWQTEVKNSIQSKIHEMKFSYTEFDDE